MYYFRSILVLLFIFFIISGCVTNQVSDRKAQQPPVEKRVVVLTDQPSWLRVRGRDIQDPGSADIIGIGGKKMEFGQWVFENDDPAKDTLVISIYSDGIAYWRGKGSITNSKLGHKVHLPITYRKGK